MVINDGSSLATQLVSSLSIFAKTEGHCTITRLSISLCASSSRSEQSPLNSNLSQSHEPKPSTVSAPTNCVHEVLPFALPFTETLLPGDFDSWYFCTSFWTALSILECNSGRYPQANKISIHTKNGARKSAWTRLSKRAGALPSKIP